MLKKFISNFQLFRDVAHRWLGIKLFDTNSVNTYHAFPPKKIVFVRSDAKWGDAIVSSFVFEALRKTYPNIIIELVTTPQMSVLFSEYYGVDRVHEIAKRPKYKQLKQLAANLGEVDVLVHMSPTLKMKDLFFLRHVDAGAIAGLDDELNLINIKLGQTSKAKHFSEKFALLLNALSIDDFSRDYIVPVNQQSLASVTAFLSQAGIAREGLIVVNLYGSGNARKMNFNASQSLLSDILHRAPNSKVVLLHTEETKSDVKRLTDNFSGRVFFYPESKTIYDAIALVHAAKRVVTVDTAIVHIASGLKKRTLAIYNPDELNFLEWHPNNPKAMTLFAKSAEMPDISNLDRQKQKESLDIFLRENEYQEVAV
ncbi:hypothetical protein CS022_13190 [Veronia nyctiphanis]|uniref:Uncharacterized protein n=1 Tax=Veronia nyctiphanis TaxID=1278244 RepID=A0A4Q0YPD3_9GAMM|nr:glycosyltransferase family 9 protein [Veronia nyctiphanis]RXJ72812.1 hypothetical protein CS022_13190 [Veronia nyctiphanis]